jgi:hypothetical protein
LTPRTFIALPKTSQIRMTYQTSTSINASQQGKPLLSVARLAAMSAVAVLIVTLLSVVLGGLAKDFGQPITLAAIGIAVIGLLSVAAVAGFLSLLPAEDVAGLSFRMLSCGMIRGGVTVIGIVALQLTLKPAAPVLILGCGAVWVTLTIIELTLALPAIRAGQTQGAGPASANSSNLNTSSARNA